mgnify:CR=1 FL=1
MSLIDQSIGTVRNAVSRFKKKPLAARAGVSDAILRNVHDADWNPCAATLRTLEGAAASLEKENGPSGAPAQRESDARNPCKGRKRA